MPAIVEAWWSLPPIATLWRASIRWARAESEHYVCVPPSARVSVSNGGREEAAVVSEGAPGDMANRIMFGEHRASEERRVVGVKRDGPERRRCGALYEARRWRLELLVS